MLDNAICVEFGQAKTANLCTLMYGIKGCTDEEYFGSVLTNVIIPDFTPKEGLKYCRL
jgi:hypothetical protein